MAVRRVYWDTMLFIYWLEEHAEFAPQVELLATRMAARGDRICASYLSLGEVLTRPYQKDNRQSIADAERLFDSSIVEMLPFDRSAAREYARLRATAKVRPADAMHLACAAAGSVDLFVTNDMELCRLQATGLPWIAGLDGRIF